RPPSGFRSARLPPSRASRPNREGISASSFLFPPLPPAKGLLGLAAQFVGGDYEYAIRILVRHVKDLQIPARYSRANLPARVPGRPQVLSRPAQDFRHFLLGNSMVVNVRLARFGVAVIADFHNRLPPRPREYFPRPDCHPFV